MVRVYPVVNFTQKSQRVQCECQTWVWGWADIPVKCPPQRQWRQQACRKGIRHRNETAERSPVSTKAHAGPWQVTGTHGGKIWGQCRRQETGKWHKNRSCRLAPIKLSKGVGFELIVIEIWDFNGQWKCCSNQSLVKIYNRVLKDNVKKLIGCYIVRSRVVIMKRYNGFSEYKDITLSIKLIKLLNNIQHMYSKML